MKQFSKLLSLALALVMVMALATTAFAADGDGGDSTNTATITVTGAVAGETYKAYKIFDYTVSADGKNYAYTIPSNSAWSNIIQSYKVYENDSDTTGKAVFSITESTDTNTKVVTVNADVNFDASAAANFAAYLAKNIPTDLEPTASAEATTTDNNTTATLRNLPLGYYFVDTSLGALCSLFNAGSTQVLNEKNTVPTLEKKIVVKENGQDKDVDSTTASIGDTINYKITVTAGKGTDSAITVHDIMESGLTLQMQGNSIDNKDFTISVTRADSSTAGNLTVNNTDYSVATGTEQGTDVTACTFEITFTADFVKKLDEGDKIVIQYTAKLNKDAEIPSTANANATNDNEAWLTYSKQESAHKTVKVSTYQFDLLKYHNVTETTGNTTTETQLDGAEFKLYDAKSDGNMINLVSVMDTTDPSKIAYYRVADATEVVTQGFTSATISAGRTIIKGLGNGTYYLEETKTPAGYNPLKERVTVTINGANLTLSESATADANDISKVVYSGNGIKVLNQAGTELPSTGGSGTTIFYVLGGILVVGAGVLLVTKKRMSGTK